MISLLDSTTATTSLVRTVMMILVGYSTTDDDASVSSVDSVDSTDVDNVDNTDDVHSVDMFFLLLN